MEVFLFMFWALGSALNTVMFSKALKSDDLGELSSSMVIAVYITGIALSWAIPAYLLGDILVKRVIRKNRKQ